VWCALAAECCAGLLKACVVVVALARAGGYQSGGGTGLPGLAGLVVVMALGVLQIVLGAFVFRGTFWAWLAAFVLAVMSVTGGGQALAMSPSGSLLIAVLIGGTPDFASGGILLSRQVRDWCSVPRGDDGDPPSDTAG
jgi:hypothetical protein